MRVRAELTLVWEESALILRKNRESLVMTRQHHQKTAGFVQNALLNGKKLIKREEKEKDTLFS